MPRPTRFACLIAGCFSLLLTSQAAVADQPRCQSACQSADQPAYQTEITLTQLQGKETQLVAKSVIRTVEDRPATIVSGGNGEKTSFTVLIERHKGKLVATTSGFVSKTNETTIAPKVKSPVGEEATMAIGDYQLLVSVKPMGETKLR